MNAEGGIDNLFGNGVLGHRSPLFLFLAKSPRREERDGRLGPG
jgi:hypothetical protein